MPDGLALRVELAVHLGLLRKGDVATIGAGIGMVFAGNGAVTGAQRLRRFKT
jgi:hypothetical protein